MRVLILACTVVLASAMGMGCSLLVDVTPGACLTSDYCDALNRRDGYAPGACFSWQCDAPALGQAGICVRRTLDWDDDGEVAASCGGTDCDDVEPRRGRQLVEACDAIDNDCDYTIDEAAFVAIDPLARMPAGAVRAAWSDEVAIAIDGASAASVLPLPPAGGLESPTAVEYSLLTAAGGPVDTGCLGTGSCDLAEAAVATRSSAPPLVAAIARAGCDRGGLRIGRLDGPVLTIVGRSSTPVASTSNVFPVADASSPSCTGPAGATMPALALLPGASNAGLAVWIDGSSAAGRACPGPAADVRALGILTFPRFVGAPMAEFVSGSDGGVPVSLGATTMRGPPAVVAVGAAGWLVAFGGTAGVEVWFVPAFADTTMESFALPDPVMVGVVSGGAVASAGMAVSERGGAFEVALAWSEGCDASAALRFVSFDFAPASPTTTLGVPLSLGSGGAPSVAAAPSFFSSDDPDAATRGTSWLVAAEGADGLVVARVVDGVALEPAYGVATGAAEPHLLVREDGRTDLFARAGGDLVQVRTSCPALAP